MRRRSLRGLPGLRDRSLRIHKHLQSYRKNIGLSTRLLPVEEVFPGGQMARKDFSVIGIPLELVGESDGRSFIGTVRVPPNIASALLDIKPYLTIRTE